MSGLFKKSTANKSEKTVQRMYGKVILVFLMFLLMIISSSLFMGVVLNNRLQERVDDTIQWIQTSLSTALLGPELPLEYMSGQIQHMLRHGEGIESIKEYMDVCSSNETLSQIYNFNYNGIFGYFEEFDTFYHGGGWTPEEDFLLKERPWYKIAVEAGGKTICTPPYLSVERETTVITYSRLLTDEQGKNLGVIAMTVPLDFTRDFITSKQVTKNGIAWLMDENMVFLVHEYDIYLNVSMYDIPNFDGIVDALKRDSEVSMYHYYNYKEEKALMFGRRLDNGWYVGIAIPEADYYRDMNIMILVINILGILMAVILSVILINIDKAKFKADTENRQKSDFLATVSHEIRTPMNTIMGVTEMQLFEERLPNNVKEAFNRIYFSGDLLLSIINDLLDLSKIEAGKLEIKPAKYEVVSLIDEIIQINKLRYASSPLMFKLQMGENIPETLIGDELRIKQILNNLLSNAFKYTSKGEIVFSVTAETQKDEDISLVFVVRDTGQGMTEEQISGLFDRFTRFNQEKNRTIEGVGLGMSITHSLIDMMNGSINVESECGKGSVFTVTLPQKLSDSRTVVSRELVENLNRSRITDAAHVKKTRILRKYMPYGSVLIVDDTEANLYVAKLLMNPYGLKIDTAASGFETIDKIKSGNTYDIIFMDHMMPMMDGIEAVKIIRYMGYSEPIVALTANAVVGQAELFLKNGFNDFIPKPIDMRVLDRALNVYIYEKQTPEVIAAAQKEKEKNEVQIRFKEPQEDEREISLLDISGLNIGRGLALFDDDPNTYLSALRSFIKNVPEIIDKLRVVTAETLPEYVVNIHGLKSISNWIAADGIRAKAANLEMLAKARDFFGVTTLNDTLLSETEELICNLRDQLKETDAGQ